MLDGMAAVATASPLYNSTKILLRHLSSRAGVLRKRLSVHLLHPKLPRTSTHRFYHWRQDLAGTQGWASYRVLSAYTC